MIAWWLACVPEFPERPAPEGDADTDTDTDTDTDADADVPVHWVVEDVAASSLEGWYAGAPVQADADPAPEVALSRAWLVSAPAAVGAFEPAGASFAAVMDPVDAPHGTCLGPLYDSAWAVAQAGAGRDVTGDGWDELPVGVPTTAGGGVVAVLSGAPLSDGVTITEVCHAGYDRFGDTVALVDDAGGGPALLASLRYGGDLVAGAAVFDWSALGAGPNDAQGTARAWVRVHERDQGASGGGTLGAIDFDGDGEIAIAFGTEGGDTHDTQRVYVLEQGLQGTYEDEDAQLAFDGVVSGATTAPTGCGPAPVLAADLDGDGVEDLVLGFSADARVAVVDAAVTAPGSDELSAAALPGPVGDLGSCFGASLAFADDHLWVGSPSDGVLSGFDAADVAAGAPEVVVTISGPGPFSGTVTATDLDADGVADLVIGGYGAYFERVYFVPGAAL